MNPCVAPDVFHGKVLNCPWLYLKGEASLVTVTSFLNVYQHQTAWAETTQTGTIMGLQSRSAQNGSLDEAALIMWVSVCILQACLCMCPWWWVPWCGAVCVTRWGGGSVSSTFWPSTWSSPSCPASLKDTASSSSWGSAPALGETPYFWYFFSFFQIHISLCSTAWLGFYNNWHLLWRICLKETPLKIRCVTF